MMKVRDNSKVPPGGEWIYRNPEDGWLVRHPYYNVCKGRAKAYRLANNYPIGLNWNDEFDENVCQQAAEDVCFDWTPPSVLEKMTGLAKALALAARAHFRTVDAAEVDRRKAICEACNFFGGYVTLLKIACRKCGCSRLALHLSTKHCPLQPPKW